MAFPPLATTADVTNLGLPITALGNLTPAQQSACIQAASDFAYSKLSGRFAPPYVSWDTAITHAVVKIAQWEMLSLRGYNPQSGSDGVIKTRADEARAWLDQVQRQAAHPQVVPAQNQIPNYSQPTVVSSSVVDLSSGATSNNRGW